VKCKFHLALLKQQNILHDLFEVLMCQFDEHHQKCGVDRSDVKRCRSNSTITEVLQHSVKL
jgi:hypothetical protein